jgi:hypothetical protein
MAVLIQHILEDVSCLCLTQQIVNIICSCDWIESSTMYIDKEKNTEGIIANILNQMHRYVKPL